MRTFQRFLNESILDDPAVKKFLARYPSYQDGIVSFAAKYGDARTIVDVTDMGNPDRVPTMEFQMWQQQAQKDYKKAKKATEKEVAKGRLPEILSQMQSRFGYQPGDVVFDTASGTRGTVKLGQKIMLSNGQADVYILTASGQQVSIGSRWKKKG